MEDKTCAFCESLESRKHIRAIWKKHGDEFDKGLRDEYTVALVVHTWHKDRGKRNAGRTTDYRYRGLGYKLNFCPECGRGLKRRKI